MWKNACLMAGALALAGCSTLGLGGASFPGSPEETVSVMRSVADWQIEQPLRHKLTDWTNGALFTGIMAAYNTTGDERYRDYLLNIGEQNEWKLGPRLRHADDHCVGQTYIELYEQLKDPKMIKPTIATMTEMMASKPESKNPVTGFRDWWWCDALYMAPPALVRLSAVTGDPKYTEWMNTNWWDCYNHLYDQEEHLWARDANFKIPGVGGKDRLEANGEKIFWSRGNGWVLGGIVRVLQYLPENHPDRARYIDVFRQMAERLAAIQPADGLWRASLLDPGAYPHGETSGSGFFTYGLAWGLNEGILDRATFQPVVEKAWQGLSACVAENGKLQWVQPIGAAPASIKAEDTEVYGVGAFLLAASEIVKLQSH